jgi:hypothetical protein
MAENIRIDQLPYLSTLDGADLLALWDVENAYTGRATFSDLINYINPLKSVNSISPTSTSNGNITLKLENLNETSNSLHFTQEYLNKLNIINNSGDGSSFLSNDGTYKTIN